MANSDQSEAKRNEDKEIWRKVPGDFYAPSIHVTKEGHIGINVGGTVLVRSVEDWHFLGGLSLLAPPAPPSA